MSVIELDNVENEKKNPGVHIDSNLAINKNVDAVCGNIKSKVALLSRIKIPPSSCKEVVF